MLPTIDKDTMHPSPGIYHMIELLCLVYGLSCVYVHVVLTLAVVFDVALYWSWCDAIYLLILTAFYRELLPVLIELVGRARARELIATSFQKAHPKLSADFFLNGGYQWVEDTFTEDKKKLMQKLH